MINKTEEIEYLFYELESLVASTYIQEELLKLKNKVLEYLKEKNNIKITDKILKDIIDCIPWSGENVKSDEDWWDKYRKNLKYKGYEVEGNKTQYSAYTENVDKKECPSCKKDNIYKEVCINCNGTGFISKEDQQQNDALEELETILNRPESIYLYKNGKIEIKDLIKKAIDQFKKEHEDDLKFIKQECEKCWLRYEQVLKASKNSRLRMRDKLVEKENKLKQSKIKIDEDVIEWLKEIDRNVAGVFEYRFIMMARELLKILEERNETE